jgi:hypothetical protein
MQKCDLQVSKLVRVDYGPFSLKKVKSIFIKALTWISHGDLNSTFY